MILPKSCDTRFGHVFRQTRQKCRVYKIICIIQAFWWTCLCSGHPFILFFSSMGNHEISPPALDGAEKIVRFLKTETQTLFLQLPFAFQSPGISSEHSRNPDRQSTLSGAICSADSSSQRLEHIGLLTRAQSLSSASSSLRWLEIALPLETPPQQPGHE